MGISRRDFLQMTALTAVLSVVDWQRIYAIAGQIKNKQDYPCVVIGSGLGGLTSAAYLSRAGFPVTVLEQYRIPGGYATNFRRGDFIFDVSLHAISVNRNATYEILNNTGVLEKITLVPLKKTHRMLSPAGDFMIPDADPVALIDLFSRTFPEERKGIEGFVKEVTGISSEANGIFHIKDFYKILFPLQYPKLWQVRNKTLSMLLDDYVKHPGARDALSYLCGYYGLPPSELSAFYYAVATGDYWTNGSYYIKGGSQKLSDAFVEVIREHNGKIRMPMSAEEIIVKDNRVQGVRIETGEVLPARIVISNANAKETFGTLIKNNSIAAAYSKKLSRYRPGLSSFTIWLGLKREIKDKISGCGIFVKGEGGLEKAFDDIRKGNFEKCGFSVTCFDNYYDGYSPAGKSTLMITCLASYEPWRRFETDYMSGRKKEYNIEKQRISDILIKRVEASLLPELSSMIDVKVMSTPLTNLFFTKNTDGAIYGYAQTMDNSFMTRLDNRTPVKGLYLASAWGYPGGGYAGVMRSGDRTFDMVMKDIG